MISRRLKHALDWRIAGVISRLDAVGARVRALEDQVQAGNRRLAALAEAVDELTARVSRLSGVADDAAATRAAIEHRVQPALRTILDEEAANRRRLFELRDSAAYASAYADPDPLVSVVVAVHGAGAPLLERALPSLLAQTHANLEVIVVGDAASPGLERAIADAGDERVRFFNLSQRLLSHPQPRRHWLVGSTMARNEGARHARGEWILHFDHDDRLRPAAIAALLELARARRAEVAYGGFEQHRPHGDSTLHIRFPPDHDCFAWPAALIHGGLRFFERELIASDLELPGDAYLLVRMLRAGVRFAMLDEILLDYFPSTLWGPAEDAATPSVLASLTQLSPTALG